MCTLMKRIENLMSTLGSCGTCTDLAFFVSCRRGVVRVISTPSLPPYLPLPPSSSSSLPPFLPPAVPLPPSPPPPTHNISLALIMNRQCQVNVDSLSDTVHKLCQPKTALLVNVHMHWTKVDVYIWTWNCGRKKRRRGESGMGVGGRHGRGRGERRRKEKGGSERHTKDCIV